ncbi:Hpt domain-containing protein [Duganella qianjiadongensis]|uniref:Phosphotransferase n=1 Tax=Duganella qianjiadongensis TaxID=2692176 RepID=A0ABW9VE53_9BURK|nr:Hpt domain-containing protein [Duganella qianjiadongensis]MYM37841.1 phosphotransferase [Duganella qianjiadongensis]
MTPVPPSPVFHVIDPAVLLEAAAGSQEIALLLSQTYIDSAPATYARLQQGLQQADFAAIGSQCHALKGMTMLIGARELTALLQEMEQAARQQQRLGAAEQRLAVLYPAVFDEMQLSIRHSKLESQA